MLAAVKHIMIAGTIEALLEVVARAARDLTDSQAAIVKHECQKAETLQGGDDTKRPAGSPQSTEAPTGLHWELFGEWLGDRPSVSYTQAQLLEHPRISEMPAGHPSLDGLAAAWIYDNERPAGVIMVSGKAGGDYTPHDEQILVQLAEFVSLRLRDLQTDAELEELTLVAQQRAAELDAVFSATTDPIIVCDADGIIMKVNPAAVLSIGADPTGTPAARLAGSLSVLDGEGSPIRPDDLIHKRALAGEAVLSRHYIATDRDGRVRHVSVSATPLMSPQGISGAVVVMHDTTQYYDLLAEQESLLQQLRKSERALAHSERLYRSIAELIPYGMWIATPEGKVTYVSRSFVDLLGVDLSKLPPGKRRELYAPEDQPRLSAAWDKAVRESSDLAVEVRLRGADGKFHWILHRGAPVRDMEGNLTAWVGVNLDVDEFKQGEEEREHLLQDVQRQQALLEAIVAQMPGSIVISLPPDGHLLYVNDKIQNIVVRPKDNESIPVCTSPWEAFTIDGEPIHHEQWPMMRAITRGEATEDLHVRVRADGVERIISAYAQPVRDEQGNILAGVMTFFDITDQMEAEEELQRHRQHLEELVRERTEALQKTNEELLTKQEFLRRLDQQLVRAEEREREALALQLHDSAAQTLAFASLKVKLMRSQVNDPRAAETLEDVTALIQQAILETRALLTQLTPPVTSGATLRQSLETLAEKMGTTYGYRTAISGPVEPVTMSMDLKILLYRSVRELLTNAAKYAQANHVWVDLSFDKQAGCVTVTDDGVGFTPSATRINHTGGFGLLSIQERLALLGGHMKVESEVDHGATFQLHFPLSPPE